MELLEVEDLFLPVEKQIGGGLFGGVWTQFFKRIRKWVLWYRDASYLYGWDMTEAFLYAGYDLINTFSKTTFCTSGD